MSTSVVPFTPRNEHGDFLPGLVPHNKRWTREACIDRVWAWFHATGRAPASSEWQPNNLLARAESGNEQAMESFGLYVDLQCPNYSQVHRLFHRWSDLIYESGLIPYLIQRGDYQHALSVAAKAGLTLEARATSRSQA